jgi:hypothetical protein
MEASRSTVIIMGPPITVKQIAKIAVVGTASVWATKLAIDTAEVLLREPMTKLVRRLKMRAIDEAHKKAEDQEQNS